MIEMRGSIMEGQTGLNSPLRLIHKAIHSPTFCFRLLTNAPETIAHSGEILDILDEYL